MTKIKNPEIRVQGGQVTQLGAKDLVGKIQVRSVCLRKDVSTRLAP